MRKPGIANGLADGRAGATQGLDVVEVDLVKFLPDEGFQLALFEELPIGVGGDDEASGNVDAATGQVLDHLTERGAFAADQCNVAEADAVERKNNSVVHGSCLSGFRKSGRVQAGLRR